MRSSLHSLCLALARAKFPRPASASLCFRVDAPCRVPDMLGNGARILLIDIKRSKLNVEQGSLDLRVPHELHQCRKAHARPNHIGSKRMAAMPHEA